MSHMQTYGHAYINIHTYARACTCLGIHTRAHTAIKEGVVNKSALSENLYQQNKFLLNFCLALRDSETDARSGGGGWKGGVECQTRVALLLP